MKKYLRTLILSLMVCCSCQREVATPINAAGLNGQSLPVKNSSAAALTDTLAIPLNAVNAKTYGAVGDGAHDDTEALQKIINAKTEIVLTAGTYIINNTLTLGPGVKIYGSGRAIIKAGNSMASNLAVYGMYFSIDNADNCSIANIKFQPSSQPFKLADWANACIRVLNSIGTHVEYNNFDFKQPYGIGGVEAVWISGQRSNNSLIKGNTLISAGIEYAENGANGTTVDGNTITNAFSDALSAHGDNSFTCTNNVVSNNTIINAGFMGIEDWGNVGGTIIENNTIVGTGKDPVQGGQGMGISAVGFNSKVMNNHITDCRLYYIEVGGDMYIYNNVINDAARLACGIFVNYTVPASPYDSFFVGSILNNTIHNCATAIQIFGNYKFNVIIKSNVITDPAVYGISVDSDAPQYTANISNNKATITKPCAQDRFCYQSYTRAPHGSVNQALTYTANTLTYAATSSGGKGLEEGFTIGADNTVLIGNVVTGNNIKDHTGLIVAGISGNGGNPHNITFTNNKVYSARVDLSGINIKSKTGNNF